MELCCLLIVHNTLSNSLEVAMDQVLLGSSRFPMLSPAEESICRAQVGRRFCTLGSDSESDVYCTLILEIKGSKSGSSAPITSSKYSVE